MAGSRIIDKIAILGIILALIITLPFGLMPMMARRCVVTVIASFLNAYPNKSLLGYTYREQIRDILPAGACSVAMAIPVLMLGRLHLPVIAVLMIQALAGVALYTGLSMLFKIDSFQYIKETIKGYASKRRGVTDKEKKNE